MNKKELIEALEKADDDTEIEIKLGEGWIEPLDCVAITFENGIGKITLR